MTVSAYDEVIKAVNLLSFYRQILVEKVFHKFWILSGA